nr:DMT family transporter [Psychromarinibacter sediminicola]
MLALTAVRSVLHILGIALVFLALRHLPVAEAIAIAYVMPFLMLILGWAVLGEQVGPRRWAACVVGFGGTLMVVQPSFAAVGAPALLPLLVAVVFALFMLVTRAIARAAAPVTLQAVSGLMATAILLPLDLSGLMGDWPLTAAPAPTRWDWVLLVGLGLLGTGAHLLMTWSLRFAPAATVAPMQYLEIPFATLIGWLIFRDFPNGLALAGIAVTMGAGLYVILREQRVSRAARVKAPGPPV